MAMNCEEIRKRYLDHDFDLVSLEVAAGLAEHFRQCNECRQAAGQYDDVRRLMRLPEEIVAPSSPPAFAFPVPEVPQHPATASAPAMASPADAKRPQSTNLPRFGMAWATALAVLLLIGASGWSLYFSRPTVESTDIAHTAVPPLAPASLPNDSAEHDAARWTRADIDHGVAVFTKVSETFDGQAGWIAVGDRGTDMGLLDGLAPPQSKVLLVRLVMSRGTQPPSTTDLVIVPGQGANVELPFEPGQVLLYRIKTAPGQQTPMTLAAEVQSQDHRNTLAGLATQLKPHAGEVVTAGQLVSQSGRYNLDVSFSETSLITAR
jgi:hypothetical protein